MKLKTKLIDGIEYVLIEQIHCEDAYHLPINIDGRYTDVWLKKDEVRWPDEMGEYEVNTSQSVVEDINKTESNNVSVTSTGVPFYEVGETKAVYSPFLLDIVSKETREEFYKWYKEKEQNKLNKDNNGR
jgi:hypothetical protein